MSNQNIQDEEYLKDTEVASRLKVGRTTVWAYAKQGLIPQPFKIGKSARWRWSQIKTAIEN